MQCKFIVNLRCVRSATTNVHTCKLFEGQWARRTGDLISESDSILVISILHKHVYMYIDGLDTHSDKQTVRLLIHVIFRAHIDSLMII